MDIPYIISARTKEEFEYVENALKKFNEFYKLENIGFLHAKKFADNIIEIFPEKTGEITDVELIKSELEGHLLRSSSNSTLLWLGENRYDIKYKNPDKK